MLMSTTDIQQLTAGIWSWQVRPRGLRAGEFGVRTSYAIAAGTDTLLVDPLLPGDAAHLLEALDDLARGQVHILVTMPYHTRSAEQLWQRYRGAGAQIFGHPKVATRLGDRAGLEAVAGGDAAAGLARFHPIGAPPGSEQAIEIPAGRVLVFGDAVVDTGDGSLRVWHRRLDSERRRRWWRERYLPTLEQLAALQPRHVLVTHGRPLLDDGTAGLRRALAQDPWQRPKRQPETVTAAARRGSSRSAGAR